MNEWGCTITLLVLSACSISDPIYNSCHTFPRHNEKWQKYQLCKTAIFIGVPKSLYTFQKPIIYEDDLSVKC